MKQNVFCSYDFLFRIVIFGDSHVNHMRKSLKHQVNISFKSPDNIQFIGIPGLCSDMWELNFDEIVASSPSLVIIMMGGNDVSIHPRKSWIIPKSPLYPFNNIMSMRKKLLLLNIPTMVVGALKRANKATNERIGQLNTELRKTLQKKYIGLGSNVRLLKDFDDETHLESVTYCHIYKQICKRVDG